MSAKRSLRLTGVLVADVAPGCGMWSAVAVAQALYPGRTIKLVVSRARAHLRACNKDDQGGGRQ